MEINFLVFPAPKCKFTEADLKGEIIWVPYYDDLFKLNDIKQNGAQVREYQSESNTAHSKNCSSSQIQLSKFSEGFYKESRKPSSKPQTRISFNKQFPHNPPDQNPSDLSRTIYDEEIDEDIPEKTISNFTSGMKAGLYVSGSFVQKNAFNQNSQVGSFTKCGSQPHAQFFGTQSPKLTVNQKIIPKISQQRPKIQLTQQQKEFFTKPNQNIYLPKNPQQTSYSSIASGVQKKVFDKEDIDSDLSLIQAEEISQDQQPSSRINKMNLQPSIGSFKKGNLQIKTNSISRVNSQTEFISSFKSVLIPSQYSSSTNLFQSMEIQSKDLVNQQRKVSKKIPCLYLQSLTNSKFLVLFFHGNGEDLSHSYQLLDHIRRQLQVNLLAMEYCGYGLYKGKPSEDIILEDSKYLYRYLTQYSNIEEKNIIIFGRSIGTGTATTLAALFNPCMLVLMSPFLSLREVVKHAHGSVASMLIQERFKNKENIQKVKCPTFILHGQKDHIIPWQHSRQLHQLCGGVCQLVTPPMMDHVRFNFHEDLTTPLKLFMKQNNIKENNDILRLSNKKPQQ